MGCLNLHNNWCSFLNNLSLPLFSHRIILFLIIISSVVNCENVTNWTKPVAPKESIDKVCYNGEPTTPKIKVTPAFVDPIGTEIISLFIPCLNGTVINATCEFHDPGHETNYTNNATVTVTASLDPSRSLAYCKLPYLHSYGRILVNVHVTKLNVDTPEIYSGFIYVTEPKEEFYMKFEDSQQHSHNNGTPPTNITTKMTMIWHSAKFPVNSTLDLFLLEYGNDAVIERKFLSGIPNSGRFFRDTDASLIESNSTVIAFKLEESPSPKSRIRVKRQNSKSITVSSNWKHGHKNYKDNSKSMVSKGMCNRAFLYSDKKFDSNTNRCDNWFESDPGVSPDGIEPCPPTLALAKVDNRFTTQTGFLSNMYDPRFFQPGGVHFFRQSVPSTTGGRQQCVYDKSGNLLIGGAVANAGSGSGLLSHWEKDVRPFCDCCYLSNNCEKYFQKRPADDGRNYKAPKPGGATGDPHIRTFDSGSYTFNGVGEFWMVKSRVNQSNFNFSMQARMEPLGVTWQASICTAFVIYDGVTKIQIELNRFYNVDVFLNDELIPFPVELESSEQLLTETASILKERYSTTVAYSTGFTFIFTRGGRSLNFIAFASQSNYGKVYGLLGYFDNNPENDLMTPDGVILPRASSSYSVIHHDFGLKWATTENESLFKYGSEKNWMSYSQLGFLPWFPGQQEKATATAPVPPNVTSTCGNSTECLFDWTATGDLELANQTGWAIRELDGMLETLLKPVYLCDVINPIKNGNFNLTNYIVGSIVHFSCQSLDYLLIGSNNLTCVSDHKNGSDPYWNGKIPTCEILPTTTEYINAVENVCEEIRVPFSSYPHRVYVREGCSFRLNCLTYSMFRNSSYNDNMIIWNKDNSVFAFYYKNGLNGWNWQTLPTPGVQLLIGESTESEIVLENATQDSAGSYECEAVADTSEFVWLSKRHEVTVLKRQDPFPVLIRNVPN